jgi:hypothetical protein
VGIESVFWTGVFLAAKEFASLKSGVTGFFKFSWGTSIRLFFLTLLGLKQPKLEHVAILPFSSKPIQHAGVGFYWFYIECHIDYRWSGLTTKMKYSIVWIG